MRAEHTPFVLAITLILGALTPCAHAEPTGYGQVETFQPGKKYNCVPATDGKGWDCKEIGKADAAADSVQSAAAEVKPSDSAPTPSTPSSATPLEKAARIGSSTETTSSASALPSYLTGASAAGNPPPSPAPAAATASSPPVSAHAEHATNAAHAPATSVETATIMAPTAKPHLQTQNTRPTSETAPPKPELIPRHANAPAAARLPGPRAQIAPRSDPAPVAHAAASESQHDFLALPSDHYVIELAHAEREGDLATARDAAQVAQGKVYELHLRQNDADQWLLVWGDFDSIESARAARAGLLATGTISPGWPRRIAPLQAEVRRAQE